MIIWLTSFPRSGNTLVRTILNQVYGLKTFSVYEKNNSQLENQEIIDTIGATPYEGEYNDFIQEARDSPKPVIVKTHHRPESGDAAIYIVRNGIVATDSYRHYIHTFRNKHPEWADLVGGLTTKMPTWSQHLDAWNPTSRPNTLIVKYEDIVSENAQDTIASIGDFCGVVEKQPWNNPWEQMHSAGPNFFRRGRASVPPSITAKEAEVFLEAGNNREWMRHFNYNVQAPLFERLGYRIKNWRQPK